MSRPKRHAGMILNHDGYLRVKRGPMRDQMAHRVYAARQLGLQVLPQKYEVHHECMNRACWPPSDFHLVICDEVLGPFMYRTFAQKKARRWRKRAA